MEEKSSWAPFFHIHAASQLFEAKLEQDSVEDTEISEENARKAKDTIWGQIYTQSKRHELWSELS